MGTKSSETRKSGTGGGPGKRPKGKRPKERMLFTEWLKKHGRIVYGGLAAVFALSFVLFGVGNSGGFGLNDILRNNGGGPSGTTTTITSSDVKDALAATKASPNDPAAWVRLGAAYAAQAGEATTADAAVESYKQSVAAYEKAKALKASDVPILSALAEAYVAQAAAVQGQVQALYSEAASLGSASGTSVFLPPGSSADALSQAADAALSNRKTVLYTKATPLASSVTALTQKAFDVYKQLTALRPNDPALWFQEAQAAEAVGDKATAAADYRHFLALVPADPLAPAVKTLIDNLEGKTAPAATTTTPATSGTTQKTTAPAGTTTTG